MSAKPRHRTSQLDKELAFLFGQQIVGMSQQMTPADLIAEAELVAEGARQLRQHTGQPAVQRQIVRGMTDETAAALCKWIKEPETAGKYLANQTSEAKQ